MAAKKKSAIDLKMEAVMTAVHSKLGKDSLMRLDDKPQAVPVIPTGSLALDGALGIGGYPRGRIVELYGPESSGKTTLALHGLAAAQKNSEALVAFVDAEHALDTVYAAAMGVDLRRMLVSQPDCGEHALDVVENLARTGDIDLIVVDSVAALTPKAEIDGEMGSNSIGLHARLMSRAMRKLASVAHQTDTTIMFINQIRMKIGVMFGSPETTTGGNALKFYASIRLDVRKIAVVKTSKADGEKNIGIRTKVKVIKNKMAPPFRRVEMDVLWGTGIDTAGELLDLCVANGAIERAGTWYTLPSGERLPQGKAGAKEAIRNSEDIRKVLEPFAREQALKNDL